MNDYTELIKNEKAIVANEMSYLMYDFDERLTYLFSLRILSCEGPRGGLFMQEGVILGSTSGSICFLFIKYTYISFIWLNLNKIRRWE